MAKTSQVPRFVLAANVLTTTLLRAGVKLVGFGHPTYLLTVRGRKSGQPRTTPISIVEQNGQRYLLTPYGVVDWVRNLRAAGEAVLTRGRQTEPVRAQEVPPGDAALIMETFFAKPNPIGRFFGLGPHSSRADFEQAALTHPVFRLQSAAAPGADPARRV